MPPQNGQLLNLEFMTKQDSVKIESIFIRSIGFHSAT